MTMGPPTCRPARASGASPHTAPQLPTYLVARFAPEVTSSRTVDRLGPPGPEAAAQP
jgi:hypothetical protein